MIREQICSRRGKKEEVFPSIFPIRKKGSVFSPFPGIAQGIFKGIFGGYFKKEFARLQITSTWQLQRPS
jgi:hypothetical protein